MHRVMLRNIGLIAATAFGTLSACGTPRDDGAAPGTSAAARGDTSFPASERAVCPQCRQRSGGETSDFGEGSAFLPVGEGSTAAPTPCNLTRESAAIDEASARALGFGAAIDRLTTEIDLPLEWSPRAIVSGGPATGYAQSTRIMGTTRPGALQLLSSTLADCPVLILAEVVTSLSTADGALAASGSLLARIGSDHATSVISAGGAFDLAETYGTLQLEPPTSDVPLVGEWLVSLDLWPAETRLATTVAVREDRAVAPDDDDPRFVHNPLGGRAPMDACDIYTAPLEAVDTPLGAPGPVGPAHAELARRVHEARPFAARWMDGSATTVHAQVGEPFELCDNRGSVVYKVPYTVESADGRISITGDATARLVHARGAWAPAWLEIYTGGSIVDAASFADATGIRGVDFGELSGGFWHTELYFDRDGTPGITGQVTVEGVDVEGRVTGVPSAVTGVLDELTW